MYETNFAKRRSQASVHLVIARASLFADDKISGLPMRARYSIVQQFVSKLLTILQQIPFFIRCIGGRQCMVLRLCITVGLFYSPVRNIFPRISLRDLPCHCMCQIYLVTFIPLVIKKTLHVKGPRGKVSQSRVAFVSLLQRFWVQTYFCNCLQSSCLFGILFECNPNKRGQEMMSVLPNQPFS